MILCLSFADLGLSFADLGLSFADLGYIPTPDDLNDMVGQAYEFYFNEKGVIEKIVSPETSAKPAAEKKGA